MESPVWDQSLEEKGTETWRKLRLQLMSWQEICVFDVSYSMNNPEAIQVCPSCTVVVILGFYRDGMLLSMAHQTCFRLLTEMRFWSCVGLSNQKYGIQPAQKVGDMKSWVDSRQ